MEETGSVIKNMQLHYTSYITQKQNYNKKGQPEAASYHDAFPSSFARGSYKNTLAEVKATWLNCSPLFTVLQMVDLGS